jgi:2-haloacid dehalogenase
MPARIHVFDAYGTLLDVHSAVRRLAGRIGPQAAALSELWRAKQLEYCWVRTLAGAPFRDFEALTREALDHALARFPAEDGTVRDGLLAAYERLDAFPEAAAALNEMRRRGGRTAILSNGTSAMLARALEASGLAPLIDRTLSVDAARRFKTAPEAYRLVTAATGCAPSEVSFYSSNRWDIAGAAMAGFRAVWINRPGDPEEYPDCPPDRVVRSLEELGPDDAA